MVKALVSDLFFQVKVRSAAAARGVSAQIVSTGEQLLDGVSEADLVIVDLNAEGVDPVEVIEKVKSAHPGLRVVAFGPHVEKGQFDRARRAGADQVLPRSRFSAELFEILG